LPVKTTLLLREEIYERLVKKAGLLEEEREGDFLKRRVKGQR